MKPFGGKFSKYIILTLVGIVFFIYAFTLAYKRYMNFEYGKFDLGNMSQMVWNTSRGRFMEVTDQFGTNMLRWGMSHVDPILVIFAPIYWFYDNPMILVFVQHIVIISAIFPIYLLCIKKFESEIISFSVVLTYLMYPAIGFTLVWTGYHGISFVAPLFIWLVWFLEKNDFFDKKPILRKDLIIYWILIIIMLLGKEEVGAILSIYAIFIYFKNKKLAIQTFLISFIWFAFAFFIVIPAYSDLRKQSINTFIEQTAMFDGNPDGVDQGNFFIHRYEYLGSTYVEMIKNLIFKPWLITNVVFSNDKLLALNNLFGPLGYLVFLVPVWIVSIPDLAIVLLSKDEIFDISNHRIAFIISALFISYIYFLSKFKIFDRKIRNVSYRVIFSVSILLVTLYFSSMTQNPIYVSMESLIQNKIVGNVFSKSNDVSTSYKIGEIRRASIPRNDIECLNEMANLISYENPEIYSGPDYLGAQSSNRLVNALYPARYWDADLILSDIFETKTIGPLDYSGWTFNKETLRRLIESNNYKHVYSCGKISAFAKGKINDSSSFVESANYKDFDQSKVEFGTDRIKLNLSTEYIKVPEKIGRRGEDNIRILLQKVDGNFLDKTTFWTFENVSDENEKFVVIDYLSNGFRGSLDRSGFGQLVLETYYPIIPERFLAGKYSVFFGVGDLLNAREIFIGQIELVND